MYDKYEIKPLIGLTPSSKDCNCNKKKDNCKKIDIKPECGLHFTVTNYFSELVHEWEKEAARYNLGILELQNIEYRTITGENGEILTKVIFKYRKGHELFTREFLCAPKGEKGDPLTWDDLTPRLKAQLKGDSGEPGKDGKDGLDGKDGTTPTLNKVILNWVDSSVDEGGRFIEDCLSNGYNLELNLKKPDTILLLLSLLELVFNNINETLIDNYVTKDNLEEALERIENKLPDFSKFITTLPEYKLQLDNNQLNLLKNNTIKSFVQFDNLKGDKLDIRYTLSDQDVTPVDPDRNPSIWHLHISEVPEGKFVWIAIQLNNQGWDVVRFSATDGEKGKTGEKGETGSQGPQGKQGLTGASIRLRGEWEPGKTYYNNPTTSDAISYIDIVLHDGKYYMLNSIGSHNSNTSWELDKSNWVEASNFDFVATRALFAENANINYLDSNEIRIFQGDDVLNKELVAGMTSGNLSNYKEEDPINNNNNEGVRIWAGQSYTEDGEVNLNAAPFRVYDNGTVVMSNAYISGIGNFNSFRTNLVISVGAVDINDDDFINYPVYYIYTNEIPTIKKAKKTIIVNGKIINSDITLEQNKIYICLNIDNNTQMYLKIDINTGSIVNSRIEYIKPDSVTMEGERNRDNYKINIHFPISENAQAVALVYTPKSYLAGSLKDYNGWNGTLSILDKMLAKINDLWRINNRIIESSKLYSDKLCTTEVLQIIEFELDNNNTISLLLYPLRGLNFESQKNESSIYWFGEKDGDLYVVVTPDEDNNFNNPGSGIINFEKYSEGFPKFLKNQIRLQVITSQSVNETPYLELPNNTIINKDSGKVVGYRSETEIENYSDEIIILPIEQNLNTVYVKVNPKTKPQITELEKYQSVQDASTERNPISLESES